MNVDIYSPSLFNGFVAAEFIKADQRWRYEQWETLCNSPFPVLSPIPLPLVAVPVGPDPVTEQPPEPLPAI